MLACALEHMRQLNACCLGRIQGRACLSRVGVGSGFQGVSWANQELVLVGAVCEGDSWEWYIPGVVHGFEWRRQHNTVDRRTKKVYNSGFSGLEAGANETPRTTHAGKRAGQKRPGEKARERLRRREARERNRASMRQPVDRAQARSSSVEVEQKEDQQQQSSANIAAAGGDHLAAPSSAGAAAKGREDDHGEFCVRLNRNQRIIIANSGFNGTNSGGRKFGEPGRSLGFTRHRRDERFANQIGGGDGKKRGGAGRKANSWCITGRCCCCCLRGQHPSGQRERLCYSVAGAN